MAHLLSHGTDGFTTTTNAASISASSLSTTRKSGHMTKSAVRANSFETLDIVTNNLFEISLSWKTIQPISDRLNLAVSKLVGLKVGVDFKLGKNLGGGSMTHSIDIGKRYLDRFVVRNVNSGDTWHI